MFAADQGHPVPPVVEQAIIAERRRKAKIKAKVARSNLRLVSPDDPTPDTGASAIKRLDKAARERGEDDPT